MLAALKLSKVCNDLFITFCPIDMGSNGLDNLYTLIFWKGACLTIVVITCCGATIFELGFRAMLDAPNRIARAKIVALVRFCRNSLNRANFAKTFCYMAM